MAQTLLENQTKTLTVEWGQLKQRRGMYNKCQFSFFASFKKKGESFLHQTGSSKIFLFVNTRQVGIVLFLISGVLTHFKHELDMTERGVKLRDLGFIFVQMEIAAETFKQISPREFSQRFTSKSTRPSGRSFTESRQTSLQSSVITSANGSAQCRIGNTL
jgi:hypothetical protein